MVENFLSSQGVLWHSDRGLKKITGSLGGSFLNNNDEYLIYNCGLKKEIYLKNYSYYNEYEIKDKLEMCFGCDGLNYMTWEGYLLYESLLDLKVTEREHKYKGLKGIFGYKSSKEDKESYDNLLRHKNVEGSVLFRKKYGGFFFEVFDTKYLLLKKTSLSLFWQKIWVSPYRKYLKEVYHILVGVRSLLSDTSYSKMLRWDRGVKSLQVVILFYETFLRYIRYNYYTYLYKGLRVFFMRVYNYLYRKYEYMKYIENLLLRRDKESYRLYLENNKEKLVRVGLLRGLVESLLSVKKLGKRTLYYKLLVILVYKLLKRKVQLKGSGVFREKSEVLLKVINFPEKDYLKPILSYRGMYYKTYRSHRRLRKLNEVVREMAKKESKGV